MGLVLANGGDTAGPAANATSFGLATRVMAADAYAVSVSQQPTGLNCSAAGAATDALRANGASASEQLRCAGNSRGCALQAPSGAASLARFDRSSVAFAATQSHTHLANAQLLLRSELSQRVGATD